MSELPNNVEEVKPVMALKVEVTTIDGQDVRRYEFTAENCTHDQVDAIRVQLGGLLVLMGRAGPVTTNAVEEVKKVAEIDVLAVVRKLIGPVDPVGETHTDDARYTNLKNLAELVSALVDDMDRVAMHRDRSEASMRRAGGFASAFMTMLRNEE